uniref:Proteasome assembly chaperone 1 n=1 Tax=Sinocyclocheilus anshuiensis TaxID=1608454 RepID=A0A671Q6N5_9TELE
MATFFCEVLSVYSRAAEENEYDDMTNGNEEDEQIRRDQVSVHVHWLSQTDGGPVLCSDLIIAVGPNAAGFVLAYALGSDGWTAVGWVSLWNERSHGSGDPAELSCVLYQQKVTQSIGEEQASFFSAQCFTLFSQPGNHWHTISLSLSADDLSREISLLQQKVFTFSLSFHVCGCQISRAEIPQSELLSFLPNVYFIFPTWQPLAHDLSLLALMICEHPQTVLEFSDLY